MPIRIWLSAVVLCWGVLARAGELGFYYGHRPDPSEWQHLNMLVLQPDQVDDRALKGLRQRGVRPLAYISIGEVARDADYLGRLPKSALLTDNEAWNSVRLDLRRPEVRDFIVRELVQAARERGFDGVFLDTVDSFHALPVSVQPAFRGGIVALIRSVREAIGDGPLWINRGFDMLDALAPLVNGVAFESLYSGYDATSETYLPVPEADRDWLRQQIRRVIQRGLPVVAIDYLPPERVTEAPALARKIEADGAQPWITDAHLTRVGHSHVTPRPRKVLGIYESPHGDIDKSGLHLYTATPLEYLGFHYDYLPVTGDMPTDDLAGRYAGVVVWLEGEAPTENLCHFLRRAREEGLSVVFMAGIPADPDCEAVAGVTTSRTPVGRMRLGATRHGAGQFEGRIRVRQLGMTPVQLQDPAGGDIWVDVQDSQGTSFPQVAVTAAGGFALRPYLFEETPDENRYWLFDPVPFLRQALRLPMLPAPDVTTENGRWVLLAHIDGDGFVSRAEIRGTPLAAKATLDEVLKRFPIPHTVSIIEAEIAPHGLFPQLSREAEAIAREIFREPYVELASHAFSHPFVWRHLEGRTDLKQDVYGWNMPVPNYTPTVEREIAGSVDYINTRLAPPDKRVKVFLWSGDAIPGDRALGLTEALGLENTNGGDTKVLPETNSLTHVWPIGRPRPTGLQVYAPVMNENVYTNLWQGPYYGYRDVIKTFELLNAPRRLKPMDIYYHFYSGSKYASLNALIEVYTWALKHPVTPMYISEYARRARGFYDARWTEEATGQLRLHSAWPVRTLRMPVSEGWLTGPGVLGWQDKDGERYIHLAPETGALTRQRQQPAGPWLASANVIWDRVASVRDNGRWQLDFDFHAGQPGELRVRAARECVLKGSGAPATDRAKTGMVTVPLGQQQGVGYHLECR